MHILLLDRFLGGHDGPGIYLYDLIEQLLRRDHRVGMVYGRVAGDHYPRGLELFPIEGFHEEWFGSLKTKEALQRVLDRFHPTVASAQCLDVYWFSEQISKVCPLMVNLLTHAVTCPNWMRFYQRDRSVCQVDFGPACVWHTYVDRCGPSSPKALVQNIARVVAARRALRHVDAIQALTPYVKETLEKAQLPPEKIFEIPVYAPFFDAQREYSPPPREPAPLILFVGRLHPTKGPDLLLEACAKLTTPFTLAFVGGGPLAEEMEARVDAMGLGSKTRFYITEVESKNARSGQRRELISRAQMSDLYLSATVVPFLSIWGELSGIVRLEAMAHGRPLIGFDSGGTAHCIKDGVTGYVIPRLDVGALASRLERLLSEPALGEQMGRASLQFVKEHYHPEKLTIEMEEVFTRLIQNHRS